MLEALIEIVAGLVALALSFVGADYEPDRDARQEAMARPLVYAAGAAPLPSQAAFSDIVIADPGCTQVEPVVIVRRRTALIAS